MLNLFVITFITILIQVTQYSCTVNKVSVEIAKPCLF